MNAPLDFSPFCASGCRSLVAEIAITGNRKDRRYEEGSHLSVGTSDHYCDLFDRHHRRRQPRGLIGRRRAQGISPNKAFRSSLEPKLQTEAAAGSPRYSASATNGFPPNSRGAA